MKVRIGNYPSRLICRVYTRYMDKTYGIVDRPTEQSYFENFLEKLEKAIQSVYNLVNVLFLDNRKQKVKVHIDKWDTWSMDHALAPIILPMLKQLKETKHGSPFTDDEDVPEELRSTSAPPKKDEYDIDEYHHVRWDWIMDEMIWAFEQKCRDDWEEDYYGPYIEGEDDKLRSGHFEWTDDEGREAHQKRMTNGFRLFGKYYENLWD